MSEKQNAALTIGFLCLIFLLLLAADFGEKDRVYSESENRLLARKPKLSGESILSGKYMEDYEKYVTDQFVSRDTFIQIKTRSDLILGKKEVNSVYVGEDGYLLEQHLPGQFSEEQIEERLTLLKDLVDTYDAQVMLVPTADNVLTEKLPANAPCYDETGFLEQVRRTVGEEHYIDVYSALKEHAEEEIYYRTDHHWTTLGAYYGYQAWREEMHRFGPVKLLPEQLVTVTDEFLGTLHSRINLPVKADPIQYFPKTEWLRPTVTYDFTRQTDTYYEKKHLDTKNKYGYFLDDNHPFIEIDTGYHNGRSLVVIKDSFANCMVPMLGLHYEKLYVIDLRYYNGRLSDLLEGRMDEKTEMLILYDCIRFIEEFQYYK